MTKCPAGKCECVHYVSDHTDGMFSGPFCNAVGLTLIEHVELCPCPKQIQAPGKDPMEECEDELHKAGIKHYEDPKQPYRIPRDEVMGILKKHWPETPSYEPYPPIKVSGDFEKCYEEIEQHTLDWHGAGIRDILLKHWPKEAKPPEGARFMILKNELVPMFIKLKIPDEDRMQIWKAIHIAWSEWPEPSEDMKKIGYGKPTADIEALANSIYNAGSKAFMSDHYVSKVWLKEILENHLTHQPRGDIEKAAERLNELLDESATENGASNYPSFGSNMFKDALKAGGFLP